MKEIPLTQGKVARVSDHRYEWLMQWKWNAYLKKGRWYAKRSEGKWPFYKTIHIHREIMGVTDPKIQVDHKDGDGLNNQDENLRVCTNAQNSRNKGKNKNNASGYKGVQRRGRRYRAYIVVDGKQISVNGFLTAEAAAHEHDELAKKYHGDFAGLNFPD